MRRTFACLAVLVLCLASQAVAAERTANVFQSPDKPVPANAIDKIVFAKMRAQGIQPVLCSDAVFLRRAYLDVIGTLPTAEEARKFIDDKDTKNKRRALIERLLARDEFADYWSMKWGDILRIKAEFPINLWPNAAQAYHRWVRSSIVANKPYDQFARELLTSSGSNFRVGPVNFYRALQNKTPEGLATAAALTLMGSRTDGWPEGRLEGVTVFFSQVGYKPTSEWKEENVFWDPYQLHALPGNAAPGQAKISDAIGAPAAEDAPKKDAPEEEAKEAPQTPATAGPPLAAVFPDGKKVKLPADQDPREIFADWLITPENPWFTRNIANRVWAWIMGRGIIHETDDIRAGNPPSDPELLALLEKELIEHQYDLKHLYRLILTSTTYQLSSLPREKGPAAETDCHAYQLRRLDAEVLIDAVNKITGTTDLYTSAIPEPFTYIPKDELAIALADGSITSPFLALFGRSARATGMANERNNNPVSSQWLHMLNSSHIQRKLEQGPKLKEILTSGKKPKDVVEDVFLTILSRRPTQEELKTVGDYVAATKSTRIAAIDITWSLVNSVEFLYRH